MDHNKFVAFPEGSITTPDFENNLFFINLVMFWKRMAFNTFGLVVFVHMLYMVVSCLRKPPPSLAIYKFCFPFQFLVFRFADMSRRNGFFYVWIPYFSINCVQDFL